MLSSSTPETDRPRVSIRFVILMIFIGSVLIFVHYYFFSFRTSVLRACREVISKKKFMQ